MSSCATDPSPQVRQITANIKEACFIAKFQPEFNLDSWDICTPTTTDDLPGNDGNLADK